MTEEEAKEKWCPFANVAAVGKTAISSSGNRLADGKNDNLNPLASRCIGSKCMAWVGRKESYIPKGGNVTTRIVGYCGLVRK